MDQVGVPLWAPQAHWQLHPSPGLNSGLVLIYLGVWETRRLRVRGRACLSPPLFPGFRCLTPPPNPPSQGSSYRLALALTTGPTRAHCSQWPRDAPARLQPGHPDALACGGQWSGRVRLPPPKAFELIAIQFTATSSHTYWTTPLWQAAERVPALELHSSGQGWEAGSWLLTPARGLHSLPSILEILEALLATKTKRGNAFTQTIRQRCLWLPS